MGGENISIDIKRKLKVKTLREKCQYSEFYWSVFCHIRTRKTLNMDTFHAVKDI